MSIRIKIIIIVLALLMTALSITGKASTSSASNGVTKLANTFLEFKAEMLVKYIGDQWELLVKNGLSSDPAFLDTMKESIASYSENTLRQKNRSRTERILGFDSNGTLIMPAGEITLTEKETEYIKKIIDEQQSGWIELTIEGRDRIAIGYNAPMLDIYYMVTEEKETFFASVTEITNTTLIIFAATSVVSILLLLLFTTYLIRPLRNVVKAMDGIISSSDLSRRVEVEFRDETGQLAHTFNIMIGELEKANSKIKEFAYRAVLAKKQEQKIRNIFQKYVPKDVIDQVIGNQEAMLVGENRVLSVLFSDIRSFTTISESYSPDELVLALNRYFSMMVDVIMSRGGTIDKYIGDAIMAFFGAPVKHEDDAQNSVFSALEMLENLNQFNLEQKAKGKHPFDIGIGINYGVVTVGNIGSEKKMDYTVIGDMVNLASRLEGLTKKYHQRLIFSESVQRKVKELLPTRMIDTVQVKGKTRGEKIFTAKKALSESEKSAWDLHNAGMHHYYNREFKKAGMYFWKVLSLLPEDFCAQQFISRCKYYAKNPPADTWDGVEIMHEK